MKQLDNFPLALSRDFMDTLKGDYKSKNKLCTFFPLDRRANSSFLKVSPLRFLVHPDGTAFLAKHVCIIVLQLLVLQLPAF